MEKAINIIVLGANGQLGSCLRDLSSNYGDINFIFADISDIDISKKDSIDSFFAQDSVKKILSRPSILINAAAYTNVEKAEEDLIAVDEVNNKAVSLLAYKCKELGIMMLHISTDYVFDGKQNYPYKESDITNPLSIYGRSKLSGEENLINILSSQAMIVRTSWLYSQYGNNFAKKMIELAKERQNISVVIDQIGTPTYAEHLAEALMSISLGAISQGKFPFEILNYSDAGTCSWYDFAYYIFKVAGITDIAIKPILSEDYPTKAERPKYSVLNKKRFDDYYMMRRQHWTIGVEKLLRNI